MDEKQPNEVRRPTTAPVSQLITQAADALRAEGAVDWKCEGCKAAGLLPYGTQADMIRKHHQKVATMTGDLTDYETGPPWAPCGILIPTCPNCTGATSGPSPDPNSN